jgi:hypothetical protein
VIDKTGDARLTGWLVVGGFKRVVYWRLDVATGVVGGHEVVLQDFLKLVCGWADAAGRW